MVGEKSTIKIGKVKFDFDTGIPSVMLLIMATIFTFPYSLNTLLKFWPATIGTIILWFLGIDLLIFSFGYKYKFSLISKLLKDEIS